MQTPSAGATRLPNTLAGCLPQVQKVVPWSYSAYFPIQNHQTNCREGIYVSQHMHGQTQWHTNESWYLVYRQKSDQAFELGCPCNVHGFKPVPGNNMSSMCSISFTSCLGRSLASSTKVAGSRLPHPSNFCMEGLAFMHIEADQTFIVFLYLGIHSRTN